MIHFQKSGIEKLTPEGKLTLWGAYQYLQNYIHENYRWLADSTTEGHQNRLREIIENIIPNHDVTSIDQYPQDYPAEVEEQMMRVGRKKLAGGYQAKTLEQFRHIVRVILESAEAHYLRDGGDADQKNPPKSGICFHPPDSLLVRKYLHPAEELSLLTVIIPQLDECGPARLALLMMACGLRENEATGLCWNMLKKDPVTGVCTISVAQTTKTGSNEVKEGGKSENAPRIIVVPDRVYALLLDAKEKLLSQWTATGNSIDSFENLPLGTKKNFLVERCSSQYLGNFLREVFQQIGIRKEELTALSEEMAREYAERKERGLYADIADYRHPTGYTMRRATHTTGIALRYTEAERTYVAGHASTDALVDKRAFTSAQVQVYMKQKAKDRPLLNEAYSKVYRLEPGVAKNLCGDEETIVIPSGTSRVFLDIEADEPGDIPSVAIEANGSMDTSYQMSNVALFQAESGPYSPDINVLHYYHALYKEYIDAFDAWLKNYLHEKGAILQNCTINKKEKHYVQREK